MSLKVRGNANNNKTKLTNKLCCYGLYINVAAINRYFVLSTNLAFECVTYVRILTSHESCPVEGGPECGGCEARGHVEDARAGQPVMKISWHCSFSMHFLVIQMTCSGDFEIRHEIVRDTLILMYTKIGKA